MLVLFFTLSGIIFDTVHAEEKQIFSKSISFENTSILEFINYGASEIETIIVWLGDSSFLSFKLQNDWVSTIASEKSITFSTSDPLKTNDTVKFGFKTESSYPFIQWEAFDKNKVLVESGITLSESIPSFVIPQQQKSPEDPVIFPNSTFKVIPNNLHPGSTVRVTGSDFAPHSSLTLFPINERSKSFVTDENGYFMLTMKIPENQKPEKVNFILKDRQNNEKTVSLYVTEIKQEFLRTFDFTVSDIDNIFDRSDNVEFSGIANPDSSVVIKIKDPHNNLFSTEVQNTDSDGNWFSLISFLPTTPLGTYSAEITDGKNILTKSWDVVASKQLRVTPVKSSFASGEFMMFNGTAIPNERINLILVGPHGDSVLSQNFIVNPSGYFEIQYPTTPLTLDGTYILYAFQKSESEIVLAGLNAYPKKIISTQLNDVNYANSDVAIIGITGDASQNVALSIIDENDHERFTDMVEIDPDGKRTYLLDLSSFLPGLYTVLISTASFEASDDFTVDLQSSHAPITLSMVETVYYQGDSIYVTGNSQPYTKVHLYLIDPDGTIINEKHTFADENGNLSTTHFVIPHDELFGKWAITAKSGLNSENFEFLVNSLGNEGLSIRVTDVISSSVGQFVTIEGLVTEKQSVAISVKDPIGNIVFKTIVETTENGEFDLLWTAPPGAVGKYSVIVTDIYEKTVSTVIDF